MLSSRHLKSRKMTKRSVLDWGATQFIRVGGVFVVIAVVLIFLYLLYKVVPLFSNINVEATSPHQISQSHTDTIPPIYSGIDEYSSILYSVNKSGNISYYDLRGGKNPPSDALLPSHLSSSDIIAHSLITQLPFDHYAIATKDEEGGKAFVVTHQYAISYPNNTRIITPEIMYPWGEKTLPINSNTQKIALREDDDRVIVATAFEQSITLYEYTKEQSLLDDEMSFELEREEILSVNHSIDFLLINFDLRWVIALSRNGEKTFFPLYKSNIANHKQEVVGKNSKITQAKWLIGELSILVGTDKGEIEQWFPIREQGREKYQKIRTFKLSKHPITTVAGERLRKGFVATDNQGNAGVFYTSSENHLNTQKVVDKALIQTVVSPQDDEILFLDKDFQWHHWKVDNPHPEGNFKQIWQKIHYENYTEPKYLWQSSAANQDFEPKFSLTPLLFGTIKGAFYAMLFAIPLAILGAIYTAFFMSKRMRQYVKPTVEVMEALPTVILGFLAGLWMAPFVEKNLMLLFLMLFALPLGILLFGFLSSKLPKPTSAFSLQNRFITIIPLVFALTAICYIIADPVQNLFFDGDVRLYITQELGITYNQRNALVVGFAMGFAVIPTIFSITEDAIYSVPKHLVNGSLAMGASPWQTLIGVVIPTASPAIFSAVMIGLGRAVGETMIVLMATGNTPVMELNIFEGMRTLSANIAVEMPESEVDSSHFRILFLAALVLFMFTFVFNTVAESIRLKLKKKYAEL